MENWCEKTGKHMGITSLRGMTELVENIDLNSADLFKSTYSQNGWMVASGYFDFLRKIDKRSAPSSQIIRREY